MAGSCRGSLTTSAVGGYYVAVLGLHPTDSSFGRLTTISDAFDLYRFTKIRFTTMARGSNLDYTGAIAYIPSLENAAPASLNELAEVEDTTYFWSKQTVPARVNVSGAALAGSQPKWYKTRTTGNNPDIDEYQGNIMIGDDLGSAQTYVFFMEYEIEFRTPAGIGMTSAQKVPFTRMRLDEQGRGEEKSVDSDTDFVEPYPPVTTVTRVPKQRVAQRKM